MRFQTLIVFLLLRPFSFNSFEPVSAQCLDHQKSLLLAFKNTLKFNSSHSTKLVGWNPSLDCCNWPGVACDNAGNVTLLNLSNERLHGPINVSSALLGLDHLRFLNLGYNLLTGSFPASFLTFPSLEDLDLSNNRLSGKLNKVGVVSSYKLRNIDLSSNNFEGSMPEFIFKLPSLSTLALSANRFSGSLDLDVFGKFKDLYALDLSYNRFSISVNKDSLALLSLSQLNTVKLASCKLKEIPNLKNQSRLMMLDLSDNEIRGEIPNWVWGVGNGFLRFLNVSHNMFTGLQKPYTFPFLLDVLDLHSNNLQGDIPVPPRRVYHLDYSYNKFQSSIPVGFGNVLTSTLFFSVSNNKLVGVIPESIRNASRLHVLDLSHNALTGGIPMVGNMKDLETLDLSVNMINGSVPEELGSLPKLSFLNVSYNDLSGKIPQGSRLQMFTELSFEGNEGLCGPPLKKSC